jgi:hypothetical protein
VEGEGLSVETFPVLCEAAAAIEPCDGALDHPPLWQDRETLGAIGTFDDLHVDLLKYLVEGVLEDRPLLSSIGVESQEERIHAEQSSHYKPSAVTILDVRGMYKGVRNQNFCVD